ncbi:TerC family protein [Niveispirillum sp. KHB5.9]|uniref:TerC family protein n=1 Tax=Niveispirillum sp. KHB5.9 TaxID=3400269 RepID=UPI003A84EF2E
MEMFFEVSFWNALWQVILIDIVLAGDNAIVVGLAAAGVAASHRAKVIFWGIAAAVVLRIIFALLTTQLLQIVGLTLAGGILLLWVCWKMWREIRQHKQEDLGAEVADEAVNPDGTNPGAEALPSGGTKTVRQAIIQIVIADVSMSLDNVLAVAGAAHEHPEVLILGLALSVAFMGAAATAIAKLLARFHWIAYLGLAVIFYVAVKMIIDGWHQVEPLVAAHLG